VKNLKTKLAAGIAAAAILAVGGAVDAASIKGNKITLRIGSGHAPNIQYVTQMTKHFVPAVEKRVKAETKYELNFREHYTGTVVNVFDTLEGVQDGRLDIGGWCVCFDDDKAMAMNLTYYVPFGIPNAITNGHVMRAMVDEYPELYKDYEGRYNQKLIGISSFNNYGLFTGFDWEKFEDLKGRKILAAGPNLPWVKGGVPVRTAIPKAAQQMQTGVGEGIVLFPDTDFKLKLHETVKTPVYTITDFGAIVQNSLTMNLDARKKLPPEVVKIIDEVARDTEEVTFAAAQRDHEWGLEQLEKAGTKIKRIDAEAKRLWALQLKDWPNERAQFVKEKKGIDMPTIMKAYIKKSEETGHKFPIDYPIN